MARLLPEPRLRSLDMPKQGTPDWQAALAVGLPYSDFDAALGRMIPDPMARAYAHAEAMSWIERGLVVLEGKGYRLVLTRLPAEVTDPTGLVMPDGLVLRHAGDAWHVIDLVNPARSHVVTEDIAHALLEPSTLGEGDADDGASDAALLVAAGLLATSPASMPADWEPHDAYMYGASRLWLGPRRPYGAVPELVAEALPARPDRTGQGTSTGEVIALPAPGSLGEEPLGSLLARRTTSRDWGGTFTLAELATFLHAIWHVTAEPLGSYGEELRRALPSAGGLHPLQPWVVADNVEGLDRALYWYDSWDHVLVRMGEESLAMRGLLWSARSAAVQKQDSPIGALIVLTARFGRLQRKYRSIAYSAILKDVGVAMQTAYLVGTAMGLNTCALGGGNSALFEMATGIDPWVEGSVGEFVIGKPTSSNDLEKP